MWLLAQAQRVLKASSAAKGTKDRAPDSPREGCQSSKKKELKYLEKGNKNMNWRSILLVYIMLASPSLICEGGPQESAWHALKREDPTNARGLSSAEREILMAVTQAELEAYLSGLPAEAILLGDGSTLADLISQEGLGLLEIPWYSIDAGGGTSMGGAFALSGTIGQPDAAFLAGGVFFLTGGLWAVAADSAMLFGDGFESGNTDTWSATNP